MNTDNCFVVNPFIGQTPLQVVAILHSGRDIAEILPDRLECIGIIPIMARLRANRVMSFIFEKDTLRRYGEGVSPEGDP